MFRRKDTRAIRVGDVIIGGGAPVSVQSMAKVPTTDVRKVLEQCLLCHDAGCDIFRVSVPDEASAKALKEIVKESSLPIVADIHFDYRLALLSLEAGVHKLRINPGNIGSPERVKIVAKEAKARNVPIRIGVNAGSLPNDILQRYGHPTPEAMFEAAKREIFILRDIGFENIVISIKSSSPNETISANMFFAEKYDYPLHLGITEAGFGHQGIIASTVGLTRMLSLGIGDTVRVSLSDEPYMEVLVAREILRFAGLREYGVRIISCPKCARCEADTFAIVHEVWERTKHIKKTLTIAIMGCVVNGPGEAKEADFGVALGRRHALLFKKGKILAKIDENDVAQRLVECVLEFYQGKKTVK